MDEFLVYYVSIEFEGKKTALLTKNILERNKIIFDYLNSDLPQVNINQMKYYTDEQLFKEDLKKLIESMKSGANV